MNRKSKILKTSISLSSVIMGWGKELAEEKGFADNFSAYVADLIRHDKDSSSLNKPNPPTKNPPGNGHPDGQKKPAKA